MLNLFTPKKPKKKFCAEEEEDLNLATPRVFGVRKVNGKSDKEVEASKSRGGMRRLRLSEAVAGAAGHCSETCSTSKHSRDQLSHESAGHWYLSHHHQQGVD